MQLAYQPANKVVVAKVALPGKRGECSTTLADV